MKPCRWLAILLPVLLPAMTASAPVAAAEGEAREEGPFRIAFTFDDLPLGARQTDLETTRRINESILATLSRNAIQAVGFVNEKKLYQPGEMDERIEILDLWVKAGQELGNHTFSHPSLFTTPLAEFKADVIRGEIITRMLLEKAGREIRYFRHPFLRTGPSREVRDGFEAFLHEKGYQVAPVTIENWDWLFAQVYRGAVEHGDRDLARKTASAYMAFTSRQIDFCEKASIQVLGRQVRHVLLLHANQLVADTLEELIRHLAGRGYSFLDLETALSDPAYRLEDTYFGPAGVSWIFRWDNASGKKVDWKEEPEPPAWVRSAFSARRRPRNSPASTE